MSAIVQAEELSRWYGMVMGLNNVTFEIGPGLTGLVGPNGAGKSTLIQIVTGQLQPSSGRLTVFGEAPWNNPRLVQRIGYCPEREAVPKELRPLDWLRGLAYLSGMAGTVADSRCEATLDKVALPREHWGKRMGQYSKGMKQRVKLAQGLLHEPDLLVLDEPMNGLDPMGRQEVGHILKELAADGVSILISSHILAELESLCQEHPHPELGPHPRLRQPERNPRRPQELVRGVVHPVRFPGHTRAAPFRGGGVARLRSGWRRRLAPYPGKGCPGLLRTLDRLAPRKQRDGSCHPQPKPLVEEHL